MSAIFSFNMGGVSALHMAACFGHLEVCKYLVEELGGDVNAPGYGEGARGLSLSLSLFFFEIGGYHVNVCQYEPCGCVDR